MQRPAETQMMIDTELRAPVATAQLVHFSTLGPADQQMHVRDTYWVDLCLTPRPRNARACYRNRWNPHRFERLGEVFVVPPGESMHARADGGGRQASVICHLHPEPIRKWFDGDLKWSGRRLEASLDIPAATIRGLLLRLAQEMREPGFAGDVLLELIAAQLAIELGRYCAAITEKPASGGLALWRLRLIDERLKDIERPSTLEELATLCKLSVRQLTRGFRASRQCSIGDYVFNSRLDHAKHLLASDRSIKEIAATLGFSSPSSFCCAFRRATLETPMQFRHSIQRGSPGPSAG
jgi:AraC family transcriptional regulator